MRLFTVLITLFFIIVFALIIIGILYKPQLRTVKIPGNQGIFNKTCGREKVSCNLDADCEEMCTEAQSGESYICRSLPDTAGLTEAQKEILGANGPGAKDDSMKPSRYCVPEKAVMNCDISHGGIPVFAGWSGSDRMEFDCMCAYPLWASSNTCDKNTGKCTGTCELNPDVCTGGTFDWDLTQRSQEPEAGLCTCPDGTEMIIDYNAGLPKCIPSNNLQWYNDLDMTTGRRGTQPIMNVSSIVATKLSISSCDEGHYTKCDKDKVNGCCMMPDAVCCGVKNGTGLCCPKGWKCDLENGRCIETIKKCDTSSSTVCDNGCCPIVDAVCCGDGASCCPKAFPVCDPINGTCNPLPIPLLKKKCEHVHDTTCNENDCCPASDATCCPDGKHCCPSEYPVCDIENNQCKPASS